MTDLTSPKYALGEYTCPGQVPIVVVDNADLGNGTHGPWIKYRFPWETDDQASAVLFATFDQLLAIGYAPAKASADD